MTNPPCARCGRPTFFSAGGYYGTGYVCTDSYCEGVTYVKPERTFNRNVRPPSKRLPVVDSGKMDMVDCLTCEGTGQLNYRGVTVDCEDCDGTGKAPPDEDEEDAWQPETGKEITASNCLGW